MEAWNLIGSSLVRKHLIFISFQPSLHHKYWLSHTRQNHKGDWAAKSRLHSSKAPVRPFKNVARLLTEDPAHRILCCRDPRRWTIPRGRPPASWLHQVEAYLMDMGTTGLASAWVMNERRPKEKGGCGDAFLRRMLSYLTWPEPEELFSCFSLPPCHCSRNIALLHK